MSLRQLAVQVLPKLTRGLTTTAKSSANKIEKFSHEHIVHGDGFHGVRPGQGYDWEHGPHYFDPNKIVNFHRKWNIMMGALFTLGLGVPVFAVWFQQFKLSQTWQDLTAPAKA